MSQNTQKHTQGLPTLRPLPGFIGNWDPLQEQTQEYFDSLVSLQVDLYVEGELSDIQTTRQLKQARAYLEKTVSCKSDL